MKDKRNYSIDFIKLISIIIIVIHHGKFLENKLVRGYIVVDLFFFISGYFLCKTYVEKKTNIKEYVKKRIAQLYLPYILAYLLLVFTQIVIGKNNPYKYFYSPILEILLLQNVGIPKSGVLNYPLWYLSVLFYSSIIIYFLISKIDKKRYIIISNVFSIIVCIFFIIKYKEIEQWGYIGPIYLPFIRGFTDILIGTNLYYDFNKINLSKKVFYIIQVISAIGIIALLFIKGSFDYICIALEIILLFSVLNNKYIFFDKLANEKVLKKLYGLEYYIYLNHVLAIKITNKLINGNNLLKLFSTIIVLLIISWLSKKFIITINKFIENKKMNVEKA